jgi:hypothetical protein
VGVVLWLASLDSSVDRSVLKLALDRLRNSLKFRNEGAMAGMLSTAGVVVTILSCSYYKTRLRCDRSEAK